jgi:hypothetical protein
LFFWFFVEGIGRPWFVLTDFMLFQYRRSFVMASFRDLFIPCFCIGVSIAFLFQVLSRHFFTWGIPKRLLSSVLFQEAGWFSSFVLFGESSRSSQVWSPFSCSFLHFHQFKFKGGQSLNGLWG